MSCESMEEVGPGESEAVELVQLLGEVAGMEASVLDRRRLLMRRLVEMTGADGWLWSMSVIGEEDGKPASMGVIHEGLSDHQLAGIMEQSMTAKDPPPEDEHFLETFRAGKHLTRTRRQLVADEVWYRHPTVKSYRLDRGLDDFLYSIYPVGASACSAVGLFKEKGKPVFARKHVRMTHILFSNLDWLHRAGLPEQEGQSIPGLTPKQRIVLPFLIQGYTRAEVAQALEISEHTVGDHMKVIFSHFGVRSQLQLIRHFTTGDGQDDVAMACAV